MNETIVIIIDNCTEHGIYIIHDDFHHDTSRYGSTNSNDIHNAIEKISLIIMLQVILPLNRFQIIDDYKPEKKQDRHCGWCG